MDPPAMAGDVVFVPGKPSATQPGTSGHGCGITNALRSAYHGPARAALARQRACTPTPRDTSVRGRRHDWWRRNPRQPDQPGFHRRAYTMLDRTPFPAPRLVLLGAEDGPVGPRLMAPITHGDELNRRTDAVCLLVTQPAACALIGEAARALTQHLGLAPGEASPSSAARSARPEAHCPAGPV